MDEWKPIDTAPKGGEDEAILLATGSDEFPVLMGHWSRDRWVILLDGQTIWEPTHWMPLPKPPTAAR